MKYLDVVLVTTTWNTQNPKYPQDRITAVKAALSLAKVKGNVLGAKDLGLLKTGNSGKGHWSLIALDTLEAKVRKETYNIPE